MPFNGKHIILKQVVDCEYNGAVDGFDLQRQLTDWCHRELIPKISEQLGKLHTRGRVYRMDKLEIDIQIETTANWMTEAAQQIAIQVHQRVESEIKRAQTNHALLPQTYQQLFVDAFIYFLQYGNLPWWSPVTNNHIWQEELENLLITGFDDKARANLLNILQQRKVQQRILYQVPDELFIKLMVQVNQGIEKDITNLINDIKRLVSDLEERKTVLTIFRQSVMTSIYEVSAHGFAEYVYAHFVQQVSATGRLHHLQINRSKFPTSLLHKATEKEDISGNGKENKAAVNEDASSILHEGLYINNAGLIIVAPFLSALFKKLELYDGSTFTDINRAVCLTQYLASGRESVAEFELGLARIVCGLEPDTPVDTSIRFTKEEKDEVNDLLVSAIEYWSILKDTSPEGLRQSFLQRPGKLQFIEKEWLLQVEQKPWDVLLQQLPWSISMMKLPWMEYLLKTEWGY